MTAGFRIHDAHSRQLLQMDPNMTYPPRPPYGGPNSPGPREASYFSRSFNSNVVVVMAVLLFALVVAAFINTVARCILRRRRPQAPDDHNSTDKGLDKSVIEALPVVAYGAESLKSFLDPAGGTECVVCLSEFTAGEKIRLLPDCQHGFHLACIDTWLLTHTTCPVCRRSVLPASPCPDSDSSLDPACAQSIVGGSARFGSSRFHSARIASVDIEIEPSNGAPPPPTITDPGASSSSRPKPRFASILSTEVMASIIGSRRFGATRNQGSV
ncbi:hypothetical protein M758_8G083600 [Ceratodon purpureus]|nr:hypothetical protein M758_8G083600 [Ceratodon purpureus]